MQDKIAALAADMGVSRAEAQGFVDCLRAWTSKGHSVEEAIERNRATWQMLMDNYNDGIHNEYSRHRDAADALVAQAVEWFYPQRVAA